MTLWMQNLIVLVLVGACAVYLLRQLTGTFRGRQSKFGACCAKGCPPPSAAASDAGKQVFFPVENLVRQRKTTRHATDQPADPRRLKPASADPPRRFAGA